MAFDLEGEFARVRQEDSRQLAQFFAGGGLERRLAGIEENIAEIDDEAARFTFCIEDLGERNIEALERAVAFLACVFSLLLGGQGLCPCSFRLHALPFCGDPFGLCSGAGSIRITTGFFTANAFLIGQSGCAFSFGFGTLSFGLGAFGFKPCSLGFSLGALGLGTGLLETANSCLPFIIDPGLVFALGCQIACNLAEPHNVTREAAVFCLIFEVPGPELLEGGKLGLRFLPFLSGELFGAGPAGDIERTPGSEHQTRRRVIGLERRSFGFRRFIERAAIGFIFGLSRLHSAGHVFRQRCLGHDLRRRHLDRAVRLSGDDNSECLG